MTDADTYDRAAKKLEAILQQQYPDCKWSVPTSWDMIRWDMDGWGDMITQDRLEVQVKRDGFAARVPCRTAAADDMDFAKKIGEIAIYTMERYRQDHPPIDKT